MKKNIFIGLCFLFVYSCKDNGFRREYYSNGNLKAELKFISGKKSGKSLYYAENGMLDSIINYKDDIAVGQKLFFDANGNLHQVMMFNGNKADGMAYYFYQSGSISASRLYRNDKQSTFGVDFWDDTLGIVKSFIYYNEYGVLDLIKTYNKHGDLISTKIRGEKKEKDPSLEEALKDTALYRLFKETLPKEY